MASRPSTDDHLATLRQLRAAPSSQIDQTLAALEKLLATPKLHGIVVKGIAQLAQTLDARRLAPLLAAAAEKLLPDGPKRDPGCEGKSAILRTLVDWEADLPALYVAAAQWIQREPVQRGSIDTAPECRGLAAIGIARSRPPNAVLLLVDLLADPEHLVRLHTSIALSLWRGPEAIPLLRLKARHGDPNPDVLGETLMALLRHEPREQLPFVAHFLQDSNPQVVEVAAMSLGQSHQPAALPLLTSAFDRYRKEPIHTSLLMSIALLRTDDSLAWLLKLLSDAPPALGMDVLDALAIYRADSHAAALIKPAAESHRETAAAYRKIFG